MWGQVCSGKSLAYNPTGVPARVWTSSSPSRSTSPDPTRPSRTTRSRRPPMANEAWNLPAGLRPRRAGLQHRGRRQAGRQPRRAREDLPGPDQKWNDPAIAALNAGTTLPDADITPIYRSDSSGTTDSFQVPGRRRRRPGPRVGQGSQGGAGEGAQKSSGVVQAVQPRAPSATWRRARPRMVPYAQIDGAGAVALTDSPPPRPSAPPVPRATAGRHPGPECALRLERPAPTR